MCEKRIEEETGGGSTTRRTRHDKIRPKKDAAVTKTYMVHRARRQPLQSSVKLVGVLLPSRQASGYTAVLSVRTRDVAMPQVFSKLVPTLGCRFDAIPSFGRPGFSKSQNGLNNGRITAVVHPSPSYTRTVHNLRFTSTAIVLLVYDIPGRVPGTQTWPRTSRRSSGRGGPQG